MSKATLTNLLFEGFVEGVAAHLTAVAAYFTILRLVRLAGHTCAAIVMEMIRTFLG